MIKRLAIIPSRGGSKRIPHKNVRMFCGKPMINFILNTAKESGLFDTIHVSTESQKIKSIVEDLGFSIDFMRSNSLADDYTPIMPVLKFVTESYSKKSIHFDQIWLLSACSPLIESNDLLAACQLFENSKNKNALLSVSEYPVPIEWAFERNTNCDLIPVQSGMFSIRSQDFKKKYFDAGVFAIFPVENILNSQGAGSDEGFIGYILPKEKVIDIDDESDWKIAEALYKSGQIGTK